MCHQQVTVPIPDFLQSDYQYIFDNDEISNEFTLDNQGRQCFVLDACIAPVVEALWEMGIRTTGCCCGHGSGHGVVSIEVPNGNDIKRRDKQTVSFYDRTARGQGRNPHWFRGSHWDEKEQTVKQEHETLPAEATRT